MRARGVPDRTVISGESRSPAGTPHSLLAGVIQVGRLGQRSLQAGGQGFESPKLHSYLVKHRSYKVLLRRRARCVPDRSCATAGGLTRSRLRRCPYGHGHRRDVRRQIGRTFCERSFQPARQVVRARRQDPVLIADESHRQFQGERICRRRLPAGGGASGSSSPGRRNQRQPRPPDRARREKAPVVSRRQADRRQH
jgi:hypothetical protein